MRLGLSPACQALISQLARRSLPSLLVVCMHSSRHAAPGYMPAVGVDRGPMEFRRWLNETAGGGVSKGHGRHAGLPRAHICLHQAHCVVQQHNMQARRSRSPTLLLASVLLPCTASQPPTDTEYLGEQQAKLQPGRMSACITPIACSSPSAPSILPLPPPAHTHSHTC